MYGALVWTLDWMRMHPSGNVRDSHGVQWILKEEKGFWGSPGTNGSLSPRLNRHGTYRSPGWKGERTITLNGSFHAPTYQALREAEASLLGLLSDPEEPGVLTCESELGHLACEVFLDDEILCVPWPSISEPGMEFSLQLVAPDPRKYSVEWQTQQAALPRENATTGLSFTGWGGGINFVWEVNGAIFGEANNAGFTTLTNRGTAPTMPVYTLHGPLSTPTLTARQQSMTYNGVLAAGEFVVINPSAPSVMLQGTTTRRHLMSPAQFEAFAVPPASRDGMPGTLDVGLSHAGPLTDLGYVEVAYRAAWF